MTSSLLHASIVVCSSKADPVQDSSSVSIDRGSIWSLKYQSRGRAKEETLLTAGILDRANALTPKRCSRKTGYHFPDKVKGEHREKEVDPEEVEALVPTLK